MCVNCFSLSGHFKLILKTAEMSHNLDYSVLCLCQLICKMQFLLLLLILKKNLFSSFQEVQKRFPDGVPLLDPIDDMGIKDQGLKKVIQKIEAFEHRMYSHPLHNDPNLETIYKLCEKKAQVKIQTKSLCIQLERAREVVFLLAFLFIC